MLYRIRIPCVLIAVCAVLYSAFAGAAIPASERQALLDFYNSAGGVNWIYSLGWNGVAGSECGGTGASPRPWFGLTCDSTNSHIIGIYLPQNYLVGTLPASLAQLTQLQSFNVSDNNYCGGSGSACSLGGSIPALTGLTQLQAFSIEGNSFSGSIPALSGLVNLQGFDVGRNNLSGSIPTLAGLTNLQGFNASSNQLSGALPSLSGLASLAVFDVHGNQLSGTIPALAGLGNLQAFYAFTNQLDGSIPALGGLGSLQFFNVSGNQLSGAIPSLGGLASLKNFNVQDNALTGTIPSLGGLAELNAFEVGGNQLSGPIPAVPAPDSLAAGASVLCTNALTATPDTNWDAATGVTPWYSACPQAISSIDLDQHGLTGSWYQRSTSGQGFVIEAYPNLAGAGLGLLAASWYTFDVTAAGGQRWYTLQGDASAGGGAYPLTIYSTTGGNFNAAPIVKAAPVGTARMLFASCTDALLSYSFSDGSGRSGFIPLTRLDANVTCGSAGDNGNPASDFPLSGAWYNPATSGQGFFFDINPAQNVLFAGWYTYAPNGAQIGGGASQRWFTLQTTAFAPGTTSLNNVPIYATTGGTFNVGGGIATTPVGTANVSFASCSAMSLTYTFTAGPNQGQSGTIGLQRVGPTPAGCAL